MRIGIDIDDVIYPWYDRAHQLCREAGVTNGVRPSSWEPYVEYGISKERWIEVLEQAGERLYDRSPLSGVSDALERLYEAGHDIVFVTARGSFGTMGEQIKAWTHRWISRWVFMPFELHFAADKTTVPTDWFLDDHPRNVRALRGAGVHALLRHQSWNADDLDLPRVANLGEFVDLVLAEKPRRASGGLVHPLASPMRVEIEGTELLIPLASAPLTAEHLAEVRTTSATGGEKGVKLERYDLIPTNPLAELARLYGRGAAKYAARNWERGYEFSKSYAALQRHANAWWSGENTDPEMGLSHMAAVIFHAMALLQFTSEHPEFDDRPTTQEAS